jgi:hypothetical protein
VPNFTKFSGEGTKSTHDHVGQFLAQLGELADNKVFCVRLSSLSLTGTTFAWYAALPPNSIDSWNDLEHKFHKHFYSRDYKTYLADLTSLRPRDEESVNDYLRRF